MPRMLRLLGRIGPTRVLVALLGLVVLLALLAGGPQDVGAQEAGAPPARDYVSCGHFARQAAAQAFLDDGPLADPRVLDWDGDGVACEEVFGDAPPPVTSLPATGSGPAHGSAGSLALLALLALSSGLLGLRERLTQ